MRKYHPAHAAVRAVRSLPKWARASILAIAAGGSIAGLAVAALPAGASGIGGNYYSQAASGYKAAGAQFRFVKATTYLRADSKNVAQPFAEIQTGCDSNSDGPEVELIPSLDGSGTWNANGDLGGMPGTITATSSPQTFQAGQYVTMSIFYNTATFKVYFKVWNGSGQTYSATASLGQAVSLKCAGIGTLDLPAFHGDFAPPSKAQKLNAFSHVRLTSYSGHRAGLLSWWTAHKYLMVGSLNTDSPVEAQPSATNGSSFSVSLEPAS